MSLVAPPFPRMFLVSQQFLDARHRFRIARVLAHVVADLDGRLPVGAGDLDHNVQRVGFLSIGLANKVIFTTHIS